MSKILVIDDEHHQVDILKSAISSFGYKVQGFTDATALLDYLKNNAADVIVTDLQMPDMNGLTLMSKAKNLSPEIDIVVVTAHGTIETAVQAIKKGAEDYIQKPIELDQLEFVLARIFNKRKLIRQNIKLLSENELLKRDLGLKYHIANTIGISNSAKQLLANIQNYSQEKSVVLINGEPGVGTTDIARMIHYNSPSAIYPALVFECSKIPPDFHEIHLVGEQNNSKTGMPNLGHTGYIEKAHMGTLIIEDIHLLSRKCQTHLSQMIRTKTFRPLGALQDCNCDVRMIATSTPRGMAKLMQEKWVLFWDLYEMLLNNSIEVLPLRARTIDIPVLALALTRRFALQYRKLVDTLDQQLIQALTAHPLPGNYAELESLIESAVLRCQSEETVLKQEHLSLLTQK